MKASLLTVLVIAVSTLASVAGALTPADVATWPIVCSPNATESERYAATEFQRILGEMTGVTPSIVEQAQPEQPAVWIGPEAVLASGEKPGKDLGEEGLRIIAKKTSLTIDGGRPRGTLYGVYEFFEEYCGVRFLTFDHTYIPEDARTRKIRPGKHTFVPTFAFRWPYYGETMRQPDFATRIRCNTVSDDPRLGGRTGYRLVSHNVSYLLPPEKYGKDHPEYYALVEGERKIEQGGGGPQLCVSNPEVIDLVTQAVLEEIKKNPDARNINIAQMDNEHYCRCENCAAIDAREESHAGAHLALVNAVAERVEKTNPDVFISCYAYQYTRKPCKTLRARHNVMIQLCSIECCDLHPINDKHCQLNKSFCEDTAGWKKKADHIFIWHYNTNFKGYVLPFPNLRSIGESVEYFSRNNGRGVFMQAAGNGFSTEMSDLRNYVMARCLWKPGRDSWAETEEFCRLHYAEAAQPILDYLKYYHDLAAASGRHPTCFPTDYSLCLSTELGKLTLDYFNQATALAKSDVVRTRVEKASLCAYRMAISIGESTLKYDGDVCKCDLDGLVPGLVDRYAELCSRYSVTMDDEMTTSEQYIERVRKTQGGMKAVCIENDTWRVVLLPESNGKLVEMIHKPTGRNVARAARAFSRFRFEEWVRQGEGPTSQNIQAFTAEASPDKAVLRLTTPDGTAFERTVALVGDAIRFETRMTAKEARTFDFVVHPEYDAGSSTNDADEVSVYVKAPEWIQANKGWKDATPNDEQKKVIDTAAPGGAFAYYNHAQKFGIQQTFDPAQFSLVSLFWNPSRMQVNLELNTRSQPLAAGQQGAYAYEVRYLAEPPVK